MKKFLLTALAATVAAAPIAAAPAEAAQYRASPGYDYRHDGRQDNRRYDNRRGHDRQSNYNRSWRKGQRFDRRYATNYRQIDYRQYRGRHLYAPPRGYQWVQSGNDAVLVAVASGLIGAVLAGALH